MKKIMMKRISAIMMAATMAVIFCFTNYTTAFAASETNETPALSVSDSDTTSSLEVSASDTTSKHGRIEFEISPDKADENGRIPFILRDGDDDDDDENYIDQTWNFTNSHRGADRSYEATSIGFATKITDSSGNAVGDRVSIELKDYYDNELGYTAYATGAWYGHSGISIVSGRTYYFTYTDLSSATTELRIRMIIIW